MKLVALIVTLAAATAIAACRREDFVEVSAGATHSCGLIDNGEAVCWGENSDGSLDAPAGPFESVRAGWFFTCGLREDGSAECWGFAAPPPRAGPFTAIDAGSGVACGLRSADGGIECWTSLTDRPEMLQAPGGSFTAVSIDVMGCALAADGLARCWPDPGAVPAIAFTAVDAGLSGCGVLADGGHVVCWGAIEPFVAPDEPFEKITVGVAHACAIRADASVACWGESGSGVTSPPSGKFAHASAGLSHSCGLRPDGSAVCWGRNDHGETSAP